MIQTKYIIILGAIIFLIVIYYFYDEIKNVKKLFTPTYQKTMALEAKVMELEKTTANIMSNNSSKSKNESPALSITYHSDMVKKNGNLSVKYTDLSETEAKELLKNINQFNKKSTTSPVPRHISSPSREKLQIAQIKSESLSDFGNKCDQKEETDTINFNISNLTKKNSVESDIEEYENILKTLNTNSVKTDENIDSMGIDEDVMKHISESIQLEDVPSEENISDIPRKNKKNKLNYKKQN